MKLARVQLSICAEGKRGMVPFELYFYFSICFVLGLWLGFLKLGKNGGESRRFERWIELRNLKTEEKDLSFVVR